MRRFELYDTLSRETRMFVPITPPKVGLFVCGLTPYSDAHIGHAKGPVTFDVVARALRRWGYRVFSVQNVTNLDDRLIARGGESGTDPMALADRHMAVWYGDMARLGIRSVNYYPHATDYIPEILAQIQQLVDRGFAYEARGSVYYDIAKFPRYGALSGQKLDALRPGARVDPEPGKRSPGDFVLWKAATPGEPNWESPWGPGRPGWHIEDTAITVRLFGPRYDIHGGGADLKFPHHEAEIAQAEAATGESPLVNFWMHVGLLTLKGEKMSKSLGNVVGLSESIDTFSPQVVRFYYLNAHYRSPLDFVPGRSLEEAAEAYRALDSVAVRLRAARTAAGPDREGEELSPELESSAVSTVEELDELLSHDFNTRETIALLFRWTKTLTELLPKLDGLSTTALDTLLGPHDWAGEVLGLLGASESSAGDGTLSGVIRLALDARARARARSDFTEADRIRDELIAAGVRVEDDGSSTRWRLAGPSV
ncbi:MAG: cysteine--tRNA ligase [Thermoplasmata archaeon]|nr:cysteine--tRNA ligase [Thermoplasmata archaeon]